MKRFLLKISVFVGVNVLLYVLLFYCIDKGMNESHYRDLGDWNQIKSGEINADVIIMGSSRAWRQVDPEIIEKLSGKSVYNLGIDGYHVPMQLAKYEYYLKHNQPPEEIIYIVDHFSLDKRKDLFNKEQFLTVMKDTALMRVMKTYDGYKWQHYHLPYFQYSGTKEYCLAGLAQFSGLKNFESDKIKGFRSKEASWEVAFDIEKRDHPEGKRAKVNDTVRLDFEKFLLNRQSEDVKLSLVYSPDYYEFQDYITNRDSVIQIYRSITDRLTIPFFDYSDHELCKSKDYFYNPTHLNKKGSEIFTEHLAKQLYINE